MNSGLRTEGEYPFIASNQAEKEETEIILKQIQQIKSQKTKKRKI